MVYFPIGSFGNDLRRGFGRAIGLALICSVSMALAAPPTSTQPPSSEPHGAAAATRVKPLGASSRVSPELLALSAGYVSQQGRDSDKEFGSGQHALRLRGSTVLIDCTAKESGAKLLKDLEALGLVGGSAYGNGVSGWLPIAAISALTELPSLGLARAAAAATGHAAGSGL